MSANDESLLDHLDELDHFTEGGSTKTPTSSPASSSSSDFSIPSEITAEAIAKAARFYERKKQNGKLYYGKNKEKYREKGRARRAAAREANAGKEKKPKNPDDPVKPKRQRIKRVLTEEAKQSRLEKDKAKRMFMRQAYQLYLQQQKQQPAAEEPSSAPNSSST